LTELFQLWPRVHDTALWKLCARLHGSGGTVVTMTSSQWENESFDPV